jgi:RNA polymerase-binding transcription factor DksA
MATKKLIPAKAGKTAVKPVVKKIAKAAKPAPKKVIAAPKKAAPLKKAASKKAVVKPIVKKSVKPAAKKIVTKPVVKVIVKKVVSKPLPKKAAVKPTPKVVTKPTAKTAKPVSKIAPKKAIEVKKTAKPAAKSAAPKPVAIKNIPTKAVKPVSKIMAKKEEVKPPVAAAPAKKAPAATPAAEVKAKDIKVPAPKPVVIPKISTKTVRKYQPEFTKSVLDKAQRDPGAPSQRYSDGELQEFRELIQRKLEAAKKELSYLHGLITRKDEMGGDEGDNRYMTMEDGSLSMEREQLSQMASRQITFIDHLEKAVMRIENKTYGICRVTGKLIDKARLRAVPHATLSIEAKMSGK